MAVSREYFDNPELLHNDHGGEIDKGDVRFVVILLPHLPGLAKLLRADMHQLIRAYVSGAQKRIDEGISIARRLALQSGDAR
jgi:hypothetical protein